MRASSARARRVTLCAVGARRRREARLFEALATQFKVSLVDGTEHATLSRWRGRGVYLLVLDKLLMD